jgi:hypothetical protein
MKKLSDENFTYPAGTSVVSKQCGASDLPEPYAAQRDSKFEPNNDTISSGGIKLRQGHDRC